MVLDLTKEVWLRPETLTAVLNAATEIRVLGNGIDIYSHKYNMSVATNVGQVTAEDGVSYFFRLEALVKQEELVYTRPENPEGYSLL